MYQYVIALALLTSATPMLEKLPDDDDEFIALYTTIKEVMVEAELINDYHPRSPVVDNREYFINNLDYYRSEYSKLREAPSISCTSVFPERLVVWQMMKASKTYKAQLEWELALCPSRKKQLKQVIEEVELREKLWGYLDIAMCKAFALTSRRQALMQLRECIGDEAFNNGRMPSPEPVYYFQRN